MMKTIFCMMLFIFSNLVFSKEVDLELTTDFDFSLMYSPGQQGTFSLTATNHGPDESGLNSTFEDFNIITSSGGIEVQNNGAIAVDFALNEESIGDCLFNQVIVDPLPAGLFRVFSVIYFHNLQPGESQTCKVDYIVFEA